MELAFPSISRDRAADRNFCFGKPNSPIPESFYTSPPSSAEKTCNVTPDILMHAVYAIFHRENGWSSNSILMASNKTPHLDTSKITIGMNAFERQKSWMKSIHVAPDLHHLSISDRRCFQPYLAVRVGNISRECARFLLSSSVNQSKRQLSTPRLPLFWSIFGPPIVLLPLTVAIWTAHGQDDRHVFSLIVPLEH